MKGYTIQHSIDLLEKKVEAGGSGGSTAADITYDNTSSHMTADDVQEAIDELKTDIGTVAASVPTIAQYGVNRSTTEHVIGTWIDGSDLYEKVIPITGLGSTAGHTDFDVSDTDINVVYLAGVYGASGVTRAFNSVIVDAAGTPSTDYTVYAGMNDAQTLRIAHKQNMSAISGYVILQYTKPTPEANTRSKKSKKEE